MKHGTAYRFLCWILLGCALHAGALQTLGASDVLTRSLYNNSGVIIDWRFMQRYPGSGVNQLHAGTLLSVGGTGGLMTQTFTIPGTGTSEVWFEFRTNSPASPYYKATISGGGSQEYTLSAGTHTRTWEVVGTPPTWCYRAVVKNTTAAPRSYKVYYNSPGGTPVVEAIVFLNPGQEQTVNISNKSEKGYVGVEESGSNTQQYIGDGMWAPADSGRFFFSANPSDSGWYDCSGVSTDSPVTQAPLDLSSLTNNNPLALDTSTNALNNQNFALGINGVAQLLQSMQQKQEQQANNNSNALANLNTGLGNLNTGLNTVNSNLLSLNTNLSNLGASLTNGPAGEAHLSTNDLDAAGFPSATNAVLKGQEATAEVANALSGLAGAYGNLSNQVDEIDGGGDYWVVSLPSLAQVGGPTQINFNPTQYTGFNNIAAWVKGVLAWLSCIFLVKTMNEQLLSTFRAMGSWQTGKSVKTSETTTSDWSLFGLAKRVVSTLFSAGKTFLVVAGVFGTIIAIITTYFVNNGLASQVQINPFNSSNLSISQGLWLFAKFVPLDVFFFHIALYGGFKLALMVWIMGTQMALRYIPTGSGMILLGFLTLDTQAAANMTLRNFNGTNVVLQTSVGHLALPPGGMLELPEYVGSDVNVLTEVGGYSLGVVSNHWQVLDANVRVNIGIDQISWNESPTGVQALYDGMMLGSPLLVLVASLWVASVLRPKDIGNPTTM